MAYQKLIMDTQARKIIPRFMGVKIHNDGPSIELENLLSGFTDPYIMDIKMG